MASKKRDGGGSNFGLIITLVFFVLSTVILGITTYLSYAELEKKEKEKAEAQKKETDQKNERDWYRFKSNILTVYSGGDKLSGRTGPEVAQEKKQLDEGTSTMANAAKDDAGTFKDQLKEFDKIMPWRGTDVPSATFRSLLAARDQAYAAQAKLLAEARQQQTSEKERADQARADADKSKKEFAKQIDDLKKQRQADLATVSVDNDKLRKDLDEANTVANNAKTREADLNGQLVKLGGEKKRSDQDVKTAREAAKRDREELNEVKDKLTILKEKTGVDDKTLEAQALDRNAVDALRTWSKDWRIVDMDRTGKRPYINLGSTDRVTPQLTFSIHEMGKDGRLNPTPKGTLEVVQTRGSKMSQAAITWVRDSSKNPIVKGDYLFNPTWDPLAPTHVAIAGLVDLNEDHSDGTAEFIRMLRRQNVEIDAFIDVSDEKAPKLAGAGVNARTKYVIVADGLDDVNHPKMRDSVYRTAYDGLVRQVREKASTNAVPVISLRKYLDMIGYRSPKLSGRAAR